MGKTRCLLHCTSSASPPAEDGVDAETGDGAEGTRRSSRTEAEIFFRTQSRPRETRVGVGPRSRVKFTAAQAEEDLVRRIQLLREAAEKYRGALELERHGTYPALNSVRWPTLLSQFDREERNRAKARLKDLYHLCTRRQNDRATTGARSSPFVSS